MKTIPPVMNLKPAASRTGVICTALLAATAFSAYAQNTGFGTAKPASKVSIQGGLAIGDVGMVDPSTLLAIPNYATTAVAPQGGAVIAGRVGIGTNNPAVMLHVGRSTYDTIEQQIGWMITMSASNQGILEEQPAEVKVQDGEGNISIYAVGSIVSNRGVHAPLFQATQGYVVASDSRIKDVSGVSDAREDLETLKRIPIKNYTLKDKIRYGTKSYKKVVAQDVQAVFPPAVEKTTKALPDVMQVADAASAGPGVLKLTLPKETNLKAGDRVEFRNQEDTPETAAIIGVEGKTLTVALNGAKDGEKVLVYGREVNDFLTVDYEAISMLNVSATQQLAKEVEALKAENAELKKVALEMKELKALVAALEGKANGTVTVSLGK